MTDLEKLVIHGSQQVSIDESGEAIQVSPEKLWLFNFTSENTRRSYHQSVREFLRFTGFESSQQLYKTSQIHMLAWREHLKGKGYTNETIALRLAALSSLFKFLCDKQLCATNPVSGIIRPKTQSQGIGAGKTPTLTKQQVRKHLNSIDLGTLKGLRDRAILSVFYYTGGRCSEPTQLKVKDFRPDANYWVLEMTIKGGGRNIIALHPECQIALHQYLKAAGHEHEKNAWLFQPVKTGKNKGGKMSATSFYLIYKKTAKKAGLPKVLSPHSARATFITQAYEAGLEGEAIQRTVGHASITTTETYNQTAQKHRKSASLSMNF